MKIARMLVPVACVGALSASGPVAHAGGVRIVKGGPSGKAAKEKLVASFDRLRKRLAVCFCDESPDRVRVELTVGGRGKVLKAAQKDRTAYAQCAAGVLAVNKLAGTGSKYRVVVDLDPSAFRSGRSGSVGGDAMSRIKTDLKPHRAKLQACYDRVVAKNPAIAGDVKLGFLIKADGRIVDPEVNESTLDHAGVEQCLLDTLRAARLSERPGGKTVSFSLALSFQGGPRAPSVKGDPRLRPQKKGPVPAAVLNEVMNENKPRFTACYDKVARKKPDLEGHVILRFTIRGNGTVRNVKIRESTLGNAKVEKCIVEVGQSLRFPGSEGREKTRVFYPFLFERKPR